MRMTTRKIIGGSNRAHLQAELEEKTAADPKKAARLRAVADRAKAQETRRRVIQVKTKREQSSGRCAH